MGQTAAHPIIGDGPDSSFLSTQRVVMIYLVLPILVMILYGFNDSGFKKVSFRWLGFTTEWYQRLFAIPDLTTALKNSLLIATISTLLATAFGTFIALAHWCGTALGAEEPATSFSF